MKESGEHSTEPWFELWRQDDNGNQFLIAQFARLPEAETLKRALESSAHKQIYWNRLCRFSSGD